MKKLFLSLAVVMSVSLFSCGNGNNGEAADSVAADTAVEVVAEEAVAEDVVAPVADSAAEAPADTTVAAQA